jgi:hypothetical protein
MSRTSQTSYGDGRPRSAAIHLPRGHFYVPNFSELRKAEVGNKPILGTYLSANRRARVGFSHPERSRSLARSKREKMCRVPDASSSSSTYALPTLGGRKERRWAVLRRRW